MFIDADLIYVRTLNHHSKNMKIGLKIMEGIKKQKWLHYIMKERKRIHIKNLSINTFCEYVLCMLSQF